MATAWIHRAAASDILIRYESVNDAYSFLADLSRLYGASPAAQPYEVTSDGYNVAQTPSMQFSLHRDGFNGEGGDVVVLWHEEAVALGDRSEPIGFIPQESEGPWYPERRSFKELDEEIDEYMSLRAVAEIYYKAFEHRDCFSDYEWWQIQDTEDRFIEEGQYEHAINHWKNVIARARET
jgi:hypothetical protein